MFRTFFMALAFLSMMTVFADDGVMSADDQFSSAVSSNDIEELRSLIALGKRPTPSNFVQAIIEKKNEALTALTESDLDLESLGGDIYHPEDTFISTAIRLGNLTALQILLGAGANPA